MIRYLVAAVAVRVADEGARVGLLLLGLDRTTSAGIGGLLVAALLLPHVVAAPIVGLLTDRAGQPRWVLTSAAAVFAVSLAGAAVSLGRAPLPLVLVALVIGGCCGPALTGGLTSQLAVVVDERSLPRAYGADSLTYNLAGIAGPSLAAMLASLWNPTAGNLSLAASAGLGASAMAFLPTRVPPGDPRDLPDPRWSAGITVLVRDKTLATVTAASSFGQLGLGALGVVASVLASEHRHPSATGGLMTAVAVGGLVGSLLWTWHPAQPARAPMTVMMGLLGVGLPLALAAAATSSLTLAALLFASSGLCLGPLTGALFTARQHRAAEQVQAQVFTIAAGFKTTAAAGGAALGGAVAGLPSASQLLIAASSPILAGALGALTLSVMSRRERRRTLLEFGTLVARRASQHHR